MDEMTPDEARAHAAASQRAMYHTPKPKRRNGVTPEAKVTAKVNKYLDSLGCINLRTGAGSAEIDGRRISIGLAGTSDRTACLPNGMFCAVECKATTGLSPRQRRYLDRVHALGGVAIVARSVEELRAGLVAAFGEAVVTDWETSGKAARK